jgi:hypothetical protein
VTEGLAPLEAVREVGTFRLSARIFDLRAMGHRIEREWVTTPGGVGSLKYRPDRRARADRGGLLMLRRSPLRRYAQRDPVTPEVRLQVLQRDLGCVAVLLGEPPSECHGYLTLDHVKTHPAMGSAPRRMPRTSRLSASSTT